MLLNNKGAIAKTVVEEVNRALADHQRVQGLTVRPDEDFPRTNTLKVKKQEVIQRLMQLRAGQGTSVPPVDAMPEATPLYRLAAQVAPRRRRGRDAPTASRRSKHLNRLAVAFRQVPGVLRDEVRLCRLVFRAKVAKSVGKVDFSL